MDPVRILVAEDEPLIRMMITHVLINHGYDVVEAANGLEAVRLLDEAGPFGLVITDLAMPVMDGVAVAEHARAVNPETAVIFASAWAGDRNLPKPHVHLNKPYKRRQLIAAVEAALEAKAEDIRLKALSITDAT